MKKFFFAFALFVTSFTIAAESYLVVSSPAKVYDQPSAKGYVTTNRQDEDVILKPGMAFIVEETNAGWHKIQYSPGIRGFIMDSSVEKQAVLPAAGTFKVVNTSEDAVLAYSGTEWTLTVNGKTLKGRVIGSVIVFNNEFGNPSYIVTKTGGKTYIFNYDNNITNFV